MIDITCDFCGAKTESYLNSQIFSVMPDGFTTVNLVFKGDPITSIACKLCSMNAQAIKKHHDRLSDVEIAMTLSGKMKARLNIK